MTFEVDLSSFASASEKKLSQSSNQLFATSSRTLKSIAKSQNSSSVVFKSNFLTRPQVTQKKTSDSSTNILRSSFYSIAESVESNASAKKEQKAKNLPRLTKIYYMDKLLEALSSKNRLSPFYDHFIQSSQSLVYIKNTIVPKEDEILGKKVYLPPLRRQGMKTIIFDLDETLVHCNEDETLPCDLKVPIKFSAGDPIMAGLNIRPHARQILKNLSKEFEIVVFTASHSCYANEVLNVLDPNNQYISYRLYRESCMKTEDGIFIKDLRVFGNRQLKDILLVDNAFYSYGFQLTNGVPVLPFYDNKQDTELKSLEEFLLSIKSVKDVRDATAKFFMTSQFHKYCEKPEILVKMLTKQRAKIL